MPPASATATAVLSWAPAGAELVLHDDGRREAAVLLGLLQAHAARRHGGDAERLGGRFCADTRTPLAEESRALRVRPKQILMCEGGDFPGPRE